LKKNFGNHFELIETHKESLFLSGLKGQKILEQIAVKSRSTESAGSNFK